MSISNRNINNGANNNNQQHVNLKNIHSRPSGSYIIDNNKMQQQQQSNTMSIPKMKNMKMKDNDIVPLD